jgi:hypothetical protein
MTFGLMTLSISLFIMNLSIFIFVIMTSFITTYMLHVKVLTVGSYQTSASPTPEI